MLSYNVALLCLFLVLSIGCYWIPPHCGCALSPPWAMQLSPISPHQLWHLHNSVLLPHCLTFTILFHSLNLKCSHYSLCFTPKLDLHQLLNLFPDSGSKVCLGLASDMAVVNF